MNNDRPGLVITAEKVRRYSLFSLVLISLGYVARIAINWGTEDGLSRDFLCFWAASDLTLQGAAASAFDIEILGPAERSIGAKLFTWSYPPIFQLMTLPLALLPPVASQVLWCLAGCSAFAFGLKRVLPERYALLAACSTSLFLTNVYLGQTGIWITAFYLLGTLSLAAAPQRLPWGAAAFGLAAVKPHLGLLIPILLIVRREWQALAVATGALLIFVAASLLVFGPELWSLFFQMSGTTMELLNASQYKLYLLSSFFSAFHSLGVPTTEAFILHALLTSTVVGVAIRFIWISRDTQRAVALAIAAGLLIFPYVYYYDLLLLTAPLAILIRHGLAGGWLANEKGLLLLLWLGPLPLIAFAEIFDVSLGVVLPVLACFMIVRRIRHVREA
jgi:hypothetical protein